jgi:hypothetical protein
MEKSKNFDNLQRRLSRAEMKQILAGVAEPPYCSRYACDYGGNRINCPSTCSCWGSELFGEVFWECGPGVLA